MQSTRLQTECKYSCGIPGNASSLLLMFPAMRLQTAMLDLHEAYSGPEGQTVVCAPDIHVAGDLLREANFKVAPAAEAGYAEVDV